MVLGQTEGHTGDKYFFRSWNLFPPAAHSPSRRPLHTCPQKSSLREPSVPTQQQAPVPTLSGLSAGWAGTRQALACHFTLITTCGIRTIIICIGVISIRAKNVKELAQGHVPHERGGVSPDAFSYGECHALPRIMSERVLGEELGISRGSFPPKVQTGRLTTQLHPREVCEA